jgi:hypothetical protein
MAIVFDPTNKLIILDVTSITATELYSRSADWLLIDDNIKYGPVFRQVGGDDLGSGLSIPPYFFLQSVWRVKPMEAPHNLTITGNLFVDGGGIPVVNTFGNFQINVNYTVPVQAQGISTSGTPAPTAAEIWSYINRTLTASGGGSLTLAEIETSTVLAKEASSTQIKNSIANLPSASQNADAVWTAPVSTMTDKTAIGGYIKKALLTIPVFLGLK